VVVEPIAAKSVAPGWCDARPSQPQSIAAFDELQIMLPGERKHLCEQLDHFYLEVHQTVVEPATYRSYKFDTLTLHRHATICAIGITSHRLNGCSSFVSTATSLSYVKAKNSTPHRIKTADLIEIKFGTVDYVEEVTHHAKFHVNHFKGGFPANG